LDYSIIQNFINKNRSHQTLTPIGMVCHETATPNATDEAEQSYFNNNNIKASVHGFIDYDSITQTLDWFEVCWGAGYTANHNFIQIELCHFDEDDKFTEIWNRGVWLFAWVFINILKITTITTDNLMSHAEVSAKWRETDHTDPNQYFEDHNKTMDDFRNAVQEEINNQLNGGIEVQQWMIDILNKAKNYGLISGDHNPTDNASKWFVLGVVINLLEKYILKIK